LGTAVAALGPSLKFSNRRRDAGLDFFSAQFDKLGAGCLRGWNASEEFMRMNSAATHHAKGEET
jgi:hypothetical protein